MNGPPPATPNCPKCGYDLTGLARSGSSLVSCPECGQFVLPGSARLPSPTHVYSRLFFLMVAPMLAVTGACWLVSVLVPDAARGPLYYPLVWAGSIILPCVGVSLLWPGAVALTITDPRTSRPRPWRSVLVALAGACAFNGAALWVAGYVLRVGLAVS